MTVVVVAAGEHGAESPGPRGRLVGVGSIPRAFPVSTAMLTLQLALAAVGGLHPQVHAQLVARFGLAWADLGRLQLWRLVTSPLIQPQAGFGGNVLLAAVTFPLAEWRLGSRRTVVGFFAGDLVSTLPVLALTRLAAASGSLAAATVLVTHDSGLSAGCCALLTWCALSLRGRRRRVALAVLLAALVAMLAWEHRLDTSQHLAAAFGALALWAGFTWPTGSSGGRTRRRSGRPLP